MSDEAGPGPYLEIDEVHQRDRHRWWYSMLVMGIVACVCALDSYASHRRLPGTIKVDQHGRPIYFEDVDTPRRTLDEIQVRYFAERFVRMFVGVDGANAEEHLGEILNSMTPRLRTTTISEKKLAKRFASFRGENIKAVFDENLLHIRVGDYKSTDQAARIPVTVMGHVAFPPKFGAIAAGQEVAAEYFLVRLEVRRVNPGKANPFGLEIGWVERNSFDSQENLDNFVRSRGA